MFSSNQVSDETKVSLLEMLAFYNHEQPPEDGNLRKYGFTNIAEWQTNCLAEKERDSSTFYTKSRQSHAILRGGRGSFFTPLRTVKKFLTYSPIVIFVGEEFRVFYLRQLLTYLFET
jgi:hypothetical protein